MTREERLFKDIDFLEFSLERDWIESHRMLDTVYKVATRWAEEDREFYDSTVLPLLNRFRYRHNLSCPSKVMHLDGLLKEWHEYGKKGSANRLVRSSLGDSLRVWNVDHKTIEECLGYKIKHELRHIKSVTLHGRFSSIKVLQRFLDDVLPDSVTHIKINGELGWRGYQTLASTRHLVERLEYLEVSPYDPSTMGYMGLNNLFTPFIDHDAAIHFNNLKTLKLDKQKLGDNLVDVLLRNQHRLPQLDDLQIAGNDLTEEAVTRLKESRLGKRLKRLIL